MVNSVRSRYPNQKELPREAPMFLLKLFLSLAVLAGAAEAAKRSPFIGALIIALPLTSMLSMIWLYWDTQDSAKVSAFARDIFFLVPPSLGFFLPFLLEPRTHWPFWVNFGAGLAVMSGGMLLLRFLLK
jgi:glycopeptide antibiotics resistance protein